jgi:flagellar biosynthesis/type III secretory pathway M-ring protein FliF/YscJ
MNVNLNAENIIKVDFIRSVTTILFVLALLAVFLICYPIVKKISERRDEKKFIEKIVKEHK